jgi:hypothetical protein
MLFLSRPILFHFILLSFEFAVILSSRCVIRDFALATAIGTTKTANQVRAGLTDANILMAQSQARRG